MLRCCSVLRYTIFSNDNNNKAKCWEQKWPGLRKIEMDNNQRLKQSRPLTSQTKLKCYCFFRVVLFIARIHVSNMYERACFSSKSHLQSFIFLLQNQKHNFAHSQRTENLVNHSKLKADTCCCCKARKKEVRQFATGFDLTS